MNTGNSCLRPTAQQNSTSSHNSITKLDCVLLYTTMIAPQIRTAPTTTAPTTIAPNHSADLECPACGRTKDGRPSCCGLGGSWRNECGNPGDPKFAHTWQDGIKACTGWGWG